MVICTNLYYKMNKLITTLSLLAAFTFAALPVEAATVCNPVYGGGQNCVSTGNLGVSKQIRNPQTGAFVNSLGINDPKYNAGDTVMYHVTVFNNGQNNIPNITVTDSFPTLITFKDGPGIYNPNTGTLTFTIANLNAGQSQTFTVDGTVVNPLPSNQGIICNTEPPRTTKNVVVASAPGQPDQTATSETCLQNQVLGESKGGISVFPPPSLTKTPPTGPEALALIGLFPTGALGAFLRKKSSK